MEFADGKILAEIKDGVGRITFNQPEKRNAMSVTMWDGMAHALDVFEKDVAVRCVVLTGAGDKAFVSGADISQFDKLRSDADAQREYSKQTAGGRLRLATFPKPVIAEIRGFCMGGGLGIAYGFDMVRHLVDLVGPAHAHMILMTGERFDAAEAQRVGLINKVVAADALAGEVAALTATLARNAPLSLYANKRTVQAVLQDRADRDIAALNAAMSACFDSEDYKEGRRAFLDKRKPAFQGR